MTLQDRDVSVVVACARAAHEVNRVFCDMWGDGSHKPWEQAPQWQRESAMKGVAGALAGNTPEQSHESWLEEKRRTGWVHGERKDPDKKTHPCMVPYDRLPPDQRAKDALYLAVVRAMRTAMEDTSSAIAKENQA